jgi:hypothetical protein
MSKIGISAAAEVPPGSGRAPSTDRIELNEEDKSKDDFFIQIAEVPEAMIARHGKEFAMGVLVLSAKFIAEGKPLVNRAGGGDPAPKENIKVSATFNRR